jgi:hypothetical protein
MSSFLDRAKAAAEQAAARAKGEYDELQLKRALGSAYTELGKTAFDLIESGELAHDQLEEPAAKVRTLRERVAAAPDGPEEAEPESPEPIEEAEDAGDA